MTTATDTTVSGSVVAREWLVEHLRFTVPLRMLELHREATTARPHPWITWQDRVKRIARDEACAFATTDERVADSLPAIIATMGDALLGQSATGRAGMLASCLTTALAAAALTHQPDGISYLGMHWCVGCGICNRRAAVPGGESNEN